MIYYQYNRYGEYIGQVDAKKQPPRSTTVEVSTMPGEGQVAVWTGKTWVLKTKRIPTQAVRNHEREVRVPTKPTTPWGLRQRFTLAERAAIDNSTDPVVQSLVRDLNAAELINPNSVVLKEGLEYLYQQGLLESRDRVNNIKKGK